MGTAAHRNALDGANIKRVIQVTPTGSPAGSAGDADAVVAVNQPAVGVKGFNGTTWDRLRSSVNGGGATSVGAVGILTVNPVYTDGTNFRQAQSAAGANGDASAGSGLSAAAQFISNGTTFDRLRTPNVFKPFSVTVASLGVAPQTVWTPTCGKAFRMMGYTLTSSKAASVQFRDGSVATFFASGALVANTPAASPAGLGNGYLSASVNNVLQLDVDTAVPVVISGTVWGTEG